MGSSEHRRAFEESSQPMSVLAVCMVFVFFLIAWTVVFWGGGLVVLIAWTVVVFFVVVVLFCFVC